MIKFAVLVALLHVAVALPTATLKAAVSPYGTRIVGGYDADIANFPYQIAMLYDSDLMCGGSIISSTWILTAGHCFDDIGTSGEYLTIRAGSTSYKRGGQVIEVSQVIRHPGYQGYPLPVNNDIALIKLAEAINTTNASPIPLPEQDEEVPEGMAILSGWGLLSSGGSISSTLQAVQVPVVDFEVCKAIYATEGEPVYETMFCAGLLGTGGKDACQGDSGGPVLIDGKLRGAVSWGIGCADPIYMGVNTNVAYFRDWVRENSGV